MSERNEYSAIYCLVCAGPHTEEAHAARIENYEKGQRLDAEYERRFRIVTMARALFPTVLVYTKNDANDAQVARATIGFAETFETVSERYLRGES